MTCIESVAQSIDLATNLAALRSTLRGVFLQVGRKDFVFGDIHLAEQKLIYFPYEWVHIQEDDHSALFFVALATIGVGAVPLAVAADALGFGQAAPNVNKLLCEKAGWWIRRPRDLEIESDQHLQLDSLRRLYGTGIVLPKDLIMSNTIHPDGAILGVSKKDYYSANRVGLLGVIRGPVAPGIRNLMFFFGENACAAPTLQSWLAADEGDSTCSFPPPHKFQFDGASPSNLFDALLADPPNAVSDPEVNNEDIDSYFRVMGMYDNQEINAIIEAMQDQVPAVYYALSASLREDTRKERFNTLRGWLLVLLLPALLVGIWIYRGGFEMNTIITLIILVLFIGVIGVGVSAFSWRASTKTTLCSLEVRNYTLRKWRWYRVGGMQLIPHLVDSSEQPQLTTMTLPED